MCQGIRQVGQRWLPGDRCLETEDRADSGASSYSSTRTFHLDALFSWGPATVIHSSVYSKGAQGPPNPLGPGKSGQLDIICLGVCALGF